MVHGSKLHWACIEVIGCSLDSLICQVQPAVYVQQIQSTKSAWDWIACCTRNVIITMLVRGTQLAGVNCVHQATPTLNCWKITQQLHPRLSSSQTGAIKHYQSLPCTKSTLTAQEWKHIAMHVYKLEAIHPSSSMGLWWRGCGMLGREMSLAIMTLTFFAVELNEPCIISDYYNNTLSPK